MKDDPKGLENRAPFETDERVVTLSPIIDSWKGKQYAHNPAFAGDVPADNLNLLNGAGEIPDKQFHREFPESGHRVGKKGFRHGKGK